MKFHKQPRSWHCGWIATTKRSKGITLYNWT